MPSTFKYTGQMGGQVGAFNTVVLIFLTAIIGLYFAKLQVCKL